MCMCDIKKKRSKQLDSLSKVHSPLELSLPSMQRYRLVDLPECGVRAYRPP